MKYVALILSSIATALLVLAVAGMAGRLGEQRRGLPPPQVSVNAPTAQQFNDQADLKNALQALVEASSSGSSFLMRQDGGSAASLFALAPAQSDMPRERVRALPPAPPEPPVVSVILDAGSEGKAVVNGHLVRVGDPVGDGLTVRSIQVDSVTFANGKDRSLQVTVPLDRLRVLGAYPSGGRP